MAKKTVKFTFVPAQGAPVKKEVPWEEGMTVDDVVRAAGHDPDKLDISSHKKRGRVTKVKATIGEGEELQASERPSGS